MAKYRCLSDEVLLNDNYLSLPSKSRDLYTYINHKTDDFGFCSEVKSIMRMLGCKNKDLQLLIDGHFLIQFEDWLYLEKHFYINNRNLRKDRIKPTNYPEYLERVTLKPNGAYTMQPIDTKPQPNDTKTAPNTIQYNTIQSNTIQSNDNDGEIKSIDELKRRLRGV